MTSHRSKFGVIGALVALAFAAGCAPDRATAPASTAKSIQGAPVGNLSLVSLLPCAQTTAITKTKLFGPGGGAMAIGSHRLYVPPGALTDTLRITGTAPVSLFREVRFKPEGHIFAKPVFVSLSYDGCGVTDLLPLKVVYVAPNLDILEVLKTSVVTSVTRVRGTTTHFSSYMIAH